MPVGDKLAFGAREFQSMYLQIDLDEGNNPVLRFPISRQKPLTSTTNSTFIGKKKTMEDNTLPKKRPVLVSILAILTIVGAVFAFGFAGLQALVPDLSRNEVPLPAWLTLAAFFAIALKAVAAILLLSMRKIGFYLYTGFETVSALLSIVEGKIGMDYLDSGFTMDNLPIDASVLILLSVGFRIGLSILFIGGHAAHLGKMK